MVKLSDVARKAGVGIGTVSRVINNSGSVSPKTRDRVLEIIKDLDYVPNETARMFQSQNSKIVAVIIPTIWHPFYSKFAHYIELELSKIGYKTMICSSAGLVEKEIEFFHMLKQNKITSAICISYNDIEKYLDSKLNIIFFDRVFRKKITYVASNNYQGGQIVAQYFEKCNYKSVGYVGTYNKNINTEIKYRRIGLSDYLKKVKINYIEYLGEDPLINPGDFINTVLQEHDKYQALFIENDLLAAEFYSKAIAIGIKIPNELSIIGYDGIQFNNLFNPLLTTIVQPVEEMSKLCVQLIVKKLSGQKTEKRNVVNVEFFKGNSSL